ncbi:PA14 domain-containing protein, partial [Nocardia arizonensis]
MFDKRLFHCNVPGRSRGESEAGSPSCRAGLLKGPPYQRWRPAIWPGDRVWLRVVAFVVSAVAVMSLMQIIAFSPRAAGTAPRDVPLLLSPVTSETLRDVEPFASVSGSTVENATNEVGSGFDAATSVETDRSEFMVEYSNRDGTNSIVLSQVPVSVSDGGGGWVPVDTRLIEQPNSPRVAAAQTGVEVSFADSAAAHDLVRIDQQGATLAFALEGASDSSRQVVDSTATFSEALPGVDLKYEVTADSVKESLVLESTDAVGDGAWTFAVSVDGLAARMNGAAVEFTDVSGAVIAALPPIDVSDAAGGRTSGSYSLQSTSQNSLDLTVTVDPSWLSAPERQFPIVVDPTYTFGFGQQAETIAYQQGGSTCPLLCGIRTGNARTFLGTNTFWRSAIRYNVQPLAGKTITGARLDLQLASGSTTEMETTSQVNLYRADTPLGYNAVGAQITSGDVGTSGSLSAPALSTYIGEGVAATDNNIWLMLTGSETNTYSYKQLQAALVVDYNDATTPPPAGPPVDLVAPVNNSVISTVTPTLEVSAGPAGTKYCFKIAAGFDGRSGSVVDSGCQSERRWTVPKDVLQDTTYTWTVATVASGNSTPTPSNWVGHFVVDRRIGSIGPSPSDQFGPVTVNLFNGNLRHEMAGPAFDTLGGRAGLTFAYNSRQGGEGHGVRASYFPDADHNGIADAVAVTVRDENQINLDWGNIWSNVSENLPWKEDPMPAALDDHWFVVRWEGYFRAPVTGDFSFAGAHTDGAKIWIGDNLVYDDPNAATPSTDFSTATAKKSTDVSLVAGERVPLKVELYHHSTALPKMVLWAKSTTGTSQRTHNWNPRVVVTDNLYARDPAPLPSGWTLGVAGAEYVDARMLDGSVVLTDNAGGKHAWTKASEGGYIPPADEDGILAVDALGRVSITKDGTVSEFNTDGSLAAVSNVLDSKNPAGLQYLYSGSPARLTEIRDPVSGRSHLLHYNTDDSDNCYGGVSFPPGTHSAPAQKLCRIRYWDGTETRLWYIVGALARIENPGGEIFDYSYVNLQAAKINYDQAGTNTEMRLQALDSVGPLNEIREPVAVDWRARLSSYDLNAERWLIEYDSFVDDPAVAQPAHARPIQIIAPKPDGSDMGFRAQHSYRYEIVNRKAYVDVAGIDKIGVRTVTWDDAGRALSDTDGEGNTVHVEWNAKDKQTAAVDATGHRMTYLYDHADRVTDIHGPAPSNCFTGQLPTSACAATVPHTSKAYDEAITGLGAAFYDNPFVAGVPSIWATGVGTGDGSLTRSWGATPPVTDSSGGWSARFTGEIHLPQIGQYELGFTVVDGVRLWVDDVLLIDSWTDKTATAVTGNITNTVAESRHRIRIDYYNRSGSTGALDFRWAAPGSGISTTVPGSMLHPRYGLDTSQTTLDTSGGTTERAPSATTHYGYSDLVNGIDPVYGLITTKTTDPGGLDLTGRTLFEQPGSGFLRQTAAALPAGEITDPDRRSVYINYGGNETRANPCDANSAAVPQAGRVKATRSLTNSQGTANTI